MSRRGGEGRGGGGGGEGEGEGRGRGRGRGKGGGEMEGREGEGRGKGGGEREGDRVEKDLAVFIFLLQAKLQTGPTNWSTPHLQRLPLPLCRSRQQGSGRRGRGPSLYPQAEET